MFWLSFRNLLENQSVRWETCITTTTNMKTISRTAIEASLDRMDQQQMDQVLWYIRSLVNGHTNARDEKRRKALTEIRQALKAAAN